MISPKAFYKTLQEEGVDFVCGVPDSLLKEFCTFAAAVLPKEQHLITANEGTAIAIAAGSQMATGGIPLVYLQNSGLGNAVNPLLSLTDPEVYAVPMVLLVGWRGEPGVKDEPQHMKQGRVTPSMLDAMEIPYSILEGGQAEADKIAQQAVAHVTVRSGPYVILAMKDVFGAAEDGRQLSAPTTDFLVREIAISHIVEALPDEATIVSTTGHISRELYEQRIRNKQDRSSDFLTVGCMGHASQIALGISLRKPESRVVCLDGDGAAIMHMGGMATIGTFAQNNFIHVLINNGVHDSVGGQPTVGFSIKPTEIAKACGYARVIGPVVSANEIQSAVKTLTTEKTGPCFLEIRVRPGARNDLGRPKESTMENKALFIDRLRR